MMFDVYSWILSEEIQEFLRECYQPSILERLELIRTAYRPIEERLSALRILLGEAAKRREKRAISQVILLYQFAIREIYESCPGQFYIKKNPRYSGESKYASYAPVMAYASYEELLRDTISECGKCGIMVEKWEITEEKPRELIEFNLYSIRGKMFVANIYLDEERHEEIGIRKDTIEQEGGCPGNRYPFLLPFATGDLVCIDAPIFTCPVFGVLYSEDDLNGCRYIFLGIVRTWYNGCCFDMLDLSYWDIGLTSGLRVIDWMHHADLLELPKEQEFLGSISRHLISLHSQSKADAGEEFFRIFGR